MKIKKIIASLMVGLLTIGPAPMAALADGTTTDSSGSTTPTTTSDPSQTTTTDNTGSTTPTTATDPSSSSSSTSTTPADTSTTSNNSTPTTSSQPTTTTPTQTQSSTNQTGPKGPTGPIPAWAFDDAINKWVATDKSSFYWNGSLWVSPLYYYVPQPGWYHVVHGSAPAGSVTAAAPATINPLLAALMGLSDPSNSNTGPNSTNNSSLDSHNNALLNFLNNAIINNGGSSIAQSGNATVDSNTHAGDATTGPASVVENLLNLFNAMWSWSTGGLAYFFQNWFGNHTGDITINPASASGRGGQLGSYTPASDSNNTTGPNSTDNATSDSHNNLGVNSQSNGQINNNLNLLAQSGNATVSDNTTGGNATSGDATVDLNILNMLNSAIAAGQSFFGLLNIFGNFNGDVLFPNGFVNGAVGPSTSGGATASNSNTGAGSTNNASSDSNNSANLNNNASALFNNNIQTAAQSGNATVSDNTNAGSAQTGSASTNQNLYNLFNQSLFGDNAVLVLVNVMGHWVGHIVSLPSSDGSQSALLTGNATVSNNNTGPGSINNSSSDSHNSTNLNNTSSGVINNNINAGAISGDATVSDNTNAGNATTGNAKVATNIANIFGSQLSLKKWFGVLVINVFGDWVGDVGDNTSAGDPNVSASSAGSSSGSGSAPVSFHAVVNSPSSSAGSGNGESSNGSSLNSNGTNNHVSVLAATTNIPWSQVKAKAAKSSLLLEVAAGILLAAGALGALERRLRLS